MAAAQLCRFDVGVKVFHDYPYLVLCTPCFLGHICDSTSELKKCALQIVPSFLGSAPCCMHGVSQFCMYKGCVSNSVSSLSQQMMRNDQKVLGKKLACQYKKDLMLYQQTIAKYMLILYRNTYHA